MSVQFEEREWADSVYRFMNGDGTAYTVHMMPAMHGGIYVICNESSLWRWHGDNDIKFLCGNNNEYTRKAVLQIMEFHVTNRVRFQDEGN